MTDGLQIDNRFPDLEENLASKLSREMFGGLTQRRQSSGTTGASAVRIVDANPDRIGLIVVNTSANAIHVGFTPDTSATESIVLVAAGGVLTLRFRDDGQLCGDPVYGMSVAGADTFAVFEVILWGDK